MTTKTAIITGASQGIGKHIALTLAEHGYNTALIARNEEKLLQLKQLIHDQFPVSAEVYPTDVANKHQVKGTIDKIAKDFSSIDLLFNNAGIAEKGTSELDLDTFEKILQINLLGTVYMIHYIVPYMKQQQSGYIINLASRSGKIAKADLGAYAASKFAVVGFNEALYKELKDNNIKVTAINPGFVNTEMTAKSSIPNEEKIQPQDISEIVIMLLKLTPHALIKEVTLEASAQALS